MGRRQHNSSSSERDAALLKSGATVAHSVPVLKGPTLPPTPDRTSAARLEAVQDAVSRPALQPKSGQASGDGVSGLERERKSPVPLTLCESDIRVLAEFILILDRWDREAHGTPTM